MSHVADPYVLEAGLFKALPCFMDGMEGCRLLSAQGNLDLGGSAHTCRRGIHKCEEVVGAVDGGWQRGHGAFCG